MPAADGAIIIIWYRQGDDVFALTGTESVYLSDRFPAETKENYRLENEYYNMYHDIEKAKEYFTERASVLSKILSKLVKYDTPVWRQNRYEVNMRHLVGKCKKGLPKGNREGSESAFQVIRREVKEELGIHIPSDIRQYTNLGHITKEDYRNKKRSYQVFLYEINPSHLEDYKARFEERIKTHYGEVYDWKFENIKDILHDIKEQPTSYNQMSKDTIRRAHKQVFSTMSVSDNHIQTIGEMKPKPRARSRSRSTSRRSRRSNNTTKNHNS
jgi:ADP-ribose pyrophosphatase YjhB (NUDIX family)